MEHKVNIKNVKTCSFKDEKITTKRRMTYV